MKVPVLGFDPSYRSWGIAQAMLNLDTGLLENLHVGIINTEKSTNKQLRVNSDDLNRCKTLASGVFPLAKQAEFIFAEVPVGSQSSDAMKSYGVCCAILGSLLSQGHNVIQVTPEEVKLSLFGSAFATKKEMIQKAFELFPDANWPKHGNKLVLSKAEHMADAIGAILAGIKTPDFQSTLKAYNLFKENQHANHTRPI